MKENKTVLNNIIGERYEMEIDETKAIVEYTLQPGVIVITHTYVPPKHEGKGIASRLTRAVLEDIRCKGLQVIPQCEFTAKYILLHPEWEELIYRKAPDK